MISDVKTLTPFVIFMYLGIVVCGKDDDLSRNSKSIQDLPIYDM